MANSGRMKEKMEPTVVYSIKENGSYYGILGLYWDDGNY